MNKKYDVCGIGTPMIDIIINSEDCNLDELKISKGVTCLIDEKKSSFLMDYFKDRKSKMSSGGDCPNTMINIASLGGKVVYSGNIGMDEHGKIFESELRKKGVICDLSKNRGETSKCIILVTPDSERSMNLLLSKCENNRFKINKNYIIKSKYLYVTGHMFDHKHQIDAVLMSMKIARKNNVRVAFDLGDPNSVNSNKRLFYKIIKRYVNVLFANEEEAKIFANEPSYFKSLKKISKLVDVAVVKLGSKGSIMKYKNKIIRISPFKAEAVDSTGAGDMYAAGFLYGLCRKYSLEKSGKIASYVSSKVVEEYGARVDISIDDVQKIL